MNTIAAAAFAALLASCAGAFADEVATPPQDTMHEHAADGATHPAEPGALSRAGEATKRDAHEAGAAIKEGTKATGHAVHHAASATGHAVHHAASATGHAIAKGTRATGHALHQATIETGHAIHRGVDKLTGKDE